MNVRVKGTVNETSLDKVLRLLRVTLKDVPPTPQSLHTQAYPSLKGG